MKKPISNDYSVMYWLQVWRFFPPQMLQLQIRRPGRRRLIPGKTTTGRWNIRRKKQRRRAILCSRGTDRKKCWTKTMKADGRPPGITRPNKRN